ncbi:MAG: hypothetical protein PHS59_10950 [Paludibacter sp.]|nr:hypothetical protein [Paludibacter sp.]
MSLLCNTNIQEIVKDRVTGKVARIGGRMNQLLDYNNCKVTDINIIDGGYGKVRNLLSVKSIKSMLRTAIRQTRQEMVYLLHGEREMRDRKTVILDLHFASNQPNIQHKFDASISSNMIEHSPNPIWLLLNFYFITKEGGYQYHAIPNYRYTFDEFRKPTTLEHIIDDFKKMIWFNDETHVEDYTMSAIDKNGYQCEFHKTYPVSYPFMHMHVFDEVNVRELAEYMFEEATVDCIRNDEYSDNLLILKNKLNTNFLKEHSNLIEKYKEFIQNYKANDTNSTLK